MLMKQNVNSDVRTDSPDTMDSTRHTYLASKRGPIFCSVFATLNLTLATLSAARLITTGNIIDCKFSGPTTLDSTCQITKR